MANIVTTTQWGTTVISNADAITNMSNVFSNAFALSSGITPNLSPASPTGAFIQELADMEVNTSSTVAYVTSNVYSIKNTQGIFLDGLGNLFGFLRAPATFSSAVIQVTGVTGTTIPAGSIVSDSVNNYIIANNYQIQTGINNITVISTTVGQIIIPANSITTIVTPIVGWGTVNNTNPGTSGTNIQNDTSYRNTFAYSQAINSRGTEDSLYAIFLNFMNQLGNMTYIDTNGNVYPYIWGFYVYVNRTATPVAAITGETATVPVGGVYISIYAPDYLSQATANYTANLQYIAEIILNQIGANQTVNINTISGSQNFNVAYQNTHYTQINPVTVYFDSPAPVPIQFNFTIKLYSTTQSPATITNNVIAAVMSQFYLGYQNYLPAMMGVDINVADYVPTIINAVASPATFNAISVQLVTSGTPASSLSLNLNQIATLSFTAINVTLE